MSEKKIIFFPSLSSGNSKDWLIKNVPMANGVTSRFYCDTYPEEYRHKYFLLSAGHNLTKDTLRADFGLGSDCFVMGDSGGYQICTGAIKWKPETKDRVLTWLENNSDIAINLDIPPRGKLYGYNEALQLSYDNFKYFTENRQGKTMFLNVLQGANQGELDQWYHKMKDFEFDGWSVGGVGGNVYAVMYVLARFIQEKEFEKTHNKYLHLLGATAVENFWFFAVIQKALNERFDNRIQITTDSSSCNRATVFGSWFHDIDWRGMKQITCYFGNKGKTDYNLKGKLPCRLGCPACVGRTYSEVEPYDQQTYMMMTNHNLAFQTNMIGVLNNLVDSHKEMTKEILGNGYYQLQNIVRELIMSDEPVKTFYKYEQVFLKYGNMSKTQTNDKVIQEFFNFNQ